ncbi:purple acid phosphatase 5-like [Camellia sinensis]|uniref:purple acid phosphatase 5-like n=1 Tax=Camellia sinensis TaxID=4442 RepID=UPI001036F230|nr:purple acid phosphatase 5-like [Camellia sinensis]
MVKTTPLKTCIVFLVLKLTWKPVLDKIKSRLSGWKRQLLSFAAHHLSYESANCQVWVSASTGSGDFSVSHVCIHYASGYIHHATIKDLTFDTKYFYEVASNEVTRQFSFTTPPKPGPDVSYTFGVIGDLGQTADSNRTLEHYMSNPIKGQAVLFAGDLSYADDHPNHDNTKWDTFGRFIEKSVAYQPWIWSAGNHEIDLASNLEETDPFKPYLHRYCSRIVPEIPSKMAVSD